MPYRSLALTILAITGFLLIASGAGSAQQQVNLSDIGNATVTLYYYNNENGTKGAIVLMPDNPQQVNYDPALAAPGMYTFSHVPAGQWYYLEADHNGNKWYSIFYMEENVGTKTANVAIPPFKAVNASDNIRTTPTVMASPAASIPVPTMNEGPARATPGMMPLAAFLAIIITLSLVTLKSR